MKVLHLNTLNRGGAARGCINLHLGLLQQNVDSSILFLEDEGGIPNADSYWKFHEKVIFEELNSRPFVKKVTGKIGNIIGLSKYAKYLSHSTKMKHIEETRDKKYEVFTSPLTLCEITKHPLYQQADIIHLHWVNNFLDYEEFFSRNTKPLFWTLHEMFPFTGGCSFSMDCRQFEQTCIKCPQLASTKYDKYVQSLFNYKKKSLDKNKASLTIITPSRWLSENSKKSKILGSFSHYVIPYGIQQELFNINQREIARQKLNIEKDRTVILFVSDNVNNYRKGTQYLFPVIEKLSGESNMLDLLFLTVGGGNLSLGSKHRHLGLISSVKDMALIYSAADVFICPSLEDNFPNTILEALLVGTPAIGFTSGGIPEIIEDGYNGLVAEHTSSEALYQTILKWFQIKDTFDKKRIASEASNKYSLDLQAGRMINLYKKVL
jgi:glycosyltransferase involved in cell wall biosynthesis